MRGTLRRARFRSLIEGGLVQVARVEVSDSEAREHAERHQDYGFAANPVEGEGLRLEVGGHTIILRMDRTAARPELAPLEVSVWHDEGHAVTLRAGRLVEVDCDRLVINASEKVVLNTPLVEGSADANFAGTVTGQTDVIFAGKSGKGHKHPNIRRGEEDSDPPQ